MSLQEDNGVQNADRRSSYSVQADCIVECDKSVMAVNIFRIVAFRSSLEVRIFL